MDLVNKKKSIVFGSNGYIGRHLVHFLKECSSSIQAFDIQETSCMPITSYEKMDLSEKPDFSSIDWDVDYVFIFAGITGTYNGFDQYEKYIKTNEIGLLNILNSIRESPFRPHIVFPSTRLVYKGSDFPLNENDIKESKTIYAANKIACEHLLQAYSNAFDIPYTIFRICVPYGNLLGIEYSYGTIGFFMKQAKDKATISLYGDGSLRRTFTHVTDICEQIIKGVLNQKSHNEIFNISGEEMSLKNVAELIAEKFHAEIKFIPWPEKDLKIESGHTVFNAKKINVTFGLSHHYKIKEWLEEIE